MAYIPVPSPTKKGYIPIPTTVSGIPANTSKSSQDKHKSKETITFAGKIYPWQDSAQEFKLPSVKSYPTGGYQEASGYGASFKTDPYSSRPLLAQTDRKGTVLENRVAAKFDITKPQKLTRDILSNDRMPVEASQALRARLGVNYNEQLDHAISLQLSGSNVESNLRAQKLNEKGVQPLVGLENQLGHQVINGEISLLDAHRKLAEAKFMSLLEDVTAPKKAYIPIPGVPELDAKSKGLQDFGVKGNPEIGRKVKGAAEDFIANLAPVKAIAGIAGGQKPSEAFYKAYGQEEEVLDAVEVNNEYKKLLGQGMAQDKALAQARLTVRNRRGANFAENVVVGSLGATESGAAKLIKKASANGKVKNVIPKDLEPLATEARKYKSAEEFVSNNLKVGVEDFPNKSEWMKFNADVAGKTRPAGTSLYDFLKKAEGEWDAKIGRTKTGKPVVREIPIKNILQNEYGATLDEVVSKLRGNVDARNKAFAGKDIPPIQVDVATDGKISIVDGRNRLVRAYLEGKETIPAEVSGYFNFQKSQLTDFYNQAVGGANAPAIRSGTQAAAQGAESTLPVGSQATAPKTGPKALPTEGIRPTPESSLSAKSGRGSPLARNLDQTPAEVKAIENTAQQIKEPPKTVSRVVERVKKAFTSTVEYVQNSEERVRKLVSKAGTKVDDVSDPYLKATLYPGRVATKIEAGRKEVEAIVKDSKKVADEFKSTIAVIRKEVNDYLRFRHAPERNAVLGDGAAGVTTKAAQEGLIALESSPRGAKIKAIAGKAAKLNEQTLELLKDSGVISDEFYTTLRTKYKNHVPLQRVFEETEDIGAALAGRGFDVRSTGIKRAVGSSREVDDILANITTNYEQAVLRSEKNIVDQATLAFARNNKDILGDLMEVVKPKAVGKTFDGKILMEKTNDPNILQMFEKGKPVWVKINDPALAVALKGIGREKLGVLLNAIGSFTRLYSGLATRFNPEFAFPNKLRDLQETAVYLASQKGIGFKGAAKTVVKDPISIKNVLDALRGADTPGARIYEEMKSLGGTTGGFGLSTKKQTVLSLEKMEKLANSKTRRIADNLIEYVDNWNTIFEDSTRLSVYKQSLAQGMTKDRAAALAKEASINFNRMGRGGPVVNALWMFSNASIQGSAKMIRSFKNPKVLGATVLAVGSAVTAVNEWNDRVDPEWRNKVSKWDRLNGLPIVLPSMEGDGVKYITIPVSWGLKPIKVMADYAHDAVSGQDFDAQRMVSDTMTAILEAYNPIGGSDLVSALTPTFLDVPVEVARNQSWSGSKIKPDFDPNAPADIKYFQSLGETKSGQVAISISELLQDKANVAVSPADMKYAFDAYVGGAGRSVSKTMNVVTGAVSGEPAPLDEYPFISRFYRRKSEEELGSGSGTAQEEIKQGTQEVKREGFKSKEAFRTRYEEIRAMVEAGKVDEARVAVNALTDEEKEIYKSLKSSDKSRENLNIEVKIYDQFKEIRALVDVGRTEDAKALLNEMSDEEKQAYQRLKNKLVN